jgi:hypothetical protein
MTISDIIQKVSDEQFIINNLADINDKSKSFTITESTPSDYKYKMVCFDFGMNVNRIAPLDNILLVLKEIYGKDYLIEAINQIKEYNQIKDKIVPSLEDIII